MSGPPSEYEEDAARIERDYVSDGSIRSAEVREDLSDAGFPPSAIPEIDEWIADESDAWETVGPRTQDADSVARSLDRETGGAISEGRAQNIGEEVASEINAARARAAQRVSSEGKVRGENGQFIGSINNVEEQVRSDGIYYVNENTGTEGRGAAFRRS